LRRKNNRTDSVIKSNGYIGRTYRVSDNDLPHNDNDSNKIVNLAIIEANGKRLGGVRTTTQKGKNSKEFSPKHKLYKSYKTFFETKFQNGDDITVDSGKIFENPWKNNLSNKQVENIRKEIYYHSRQSVDNRKKRDELYFINNKKSRH
jgi:hypothetical protein